MPQGFSNPLCSVSTLMSNFSVWVANRSSMTGALGPQEVQVVTAIAKMASERYRERNAMVVTVRVANVNISSQIFVNF